eukprot:931604-Prymnesium_polylepis.1
MGEDFSQFLPLMRQAIAQIEWAVAPDDMLLEPLEPLVTLEHSEAHASGSGTESEGADTGTLNRERMGGGSMQLGAGGAGGQREQSGVCCAVGAGSD